MIFANSTWVCPLAILYTLLRYGREGVPRVTGSADLEPLTTLHFTREHLTLVRNTTANNFGPHEYLV